MAKGGPDILYQMVFPSDAVGFDVAKFDEFIRSQGVQFVHWRAMRCPVGMVDPDDVRRPHPHHEDCSNGYIYTKAGTVTCGFLGNSKESRYEDYGRADGSTVNIVLPRFYDMPDGGCFGDQPVEVAPFDRLYLKEEAIVVPTWHTFAAHASGVDRLWFPAVSVTDLVDANGARYAQDIDFTLRQGQIHWVSQRRPGKGVVCSVRFRYRPFWYVRNLVHEVRVAQAEDDFGDRTLQRMPQGAVLQREYFFEKEQRDSQAKDPERRQQPQPADGGFGPR